MLNKQIRSLRRKKGWSQAEFAQRLHISPSAIGMYEQGRREPSIGVLVTMAEELGVTLDYLVTGKVCMQADSSSIEQGEHILDAFALIKDLSCEDLLTLIASKLLGH